MKGLQLSIEDKQLIIESLLFNACTDVCSEHTTAQQARMIKIAELLNKDNSDVPLKNIYVFSDSEVPFDDKSTPLILEKFKNLSSNSFLSD